MMKPELAILTNIIAPYRLPLYRMLAADFNVHVIYSGREDNRDFWRQDSPRDTGVRYKKARGFLFRIPLRRQGRLFDYRYLHINPGYLWDLFRLRPRAVISNEMGFRTLTALVYGSLCRRPVWVWWEGTVHTEKDIGPLKRAVRRLIARWAQRWISWGETSTEYLLRLGIPRRRVLQVQNCVDERWFTGAGIKPALNIRPRPVVLNAGQFIDRKGIKYLLDAAARARADGYTFSLLLVGRGPERRSLEEYARQKKLQDVYFYPAVASHAMGSIYKSADIFVLPTLHDVWGLVVNEALWSGLPVLCSRYAGCARELLPPENIFDPLDGENFAAALKRALEGKLAPPDYSRLQRCRQVAGTISRGLKGVLDDREDSRLS